MQDNEKFATVLSFLDINGLKYMRSTCFFIGSHTTVISVIVMLLELEVSQPNFLFVVRCEINSENDSSICNKRQT